MKDWLKHTLKTTLKLSPIMMSAAFAQAEGVKTEAAGVLGGIFDTGVVFGRVYNDLDGDGRLDFGEPKMEGVRVYLDENDNGLFDQGETFTYTKASGLYVFIGVPEGRYSVRQELPFGWRNTSGGEGEDAVPTIISPSSDKFTTKIIGGDEVEESEYPFMVAVGFSSGDSFSQFCGGVLITDRWVATAAHCSEGAGPGNVNVLVGTNDTQDGSGQVLDVSQVLLHPEYILDPTEPGTPFGVSGGYDIALWQLAEPVALEENGLQTVAMLNLGNADLANDGALATAVGWGVSDLDSRLLQDVHLPVFDTQACQDVYSGAINFETQICGGVPEGGIDACQGDSGGPLLVRDFDAEVWKLAGVTSYGNGCALPGNPGVWARVSELSAWAEQAATEVSRYYPIDVKPLSFTRANFGNQSTRFEPSEAIEPRWQLVNALVADDPELGLTFDWRILDEAFMPRVFDCEIDSDGAGSIPGVKIDCFSGDNSAALQSLDDGIYITSLTAQYEGTQFSRNSTVILGSPSEADIAGTLTIEDTIDPDYLPTIYYIDYFDIDGLSGDKAVALRVTSEGIPDLFVGLYDRDIREAQGFGGELQTVFVGGVGESTEMIFVPDPEVNYVLGVSSLGIEVVGDYRVSVVNEGFAVPTALSAPTEMRRDLRGLRKVPEVKSVVSYPIAE